MTPPAGRPLDEAARRRRSVADAIIRDAVDASAGLWQPRRAQLDRLLLRLERAAERGDPAAFAFLRLVDEAAHQAASYARDWIPDLLEYDARLREVAADDAAALAPGPLDPTRARPALNVIPLDRRAFQTVAGIVSQTVASVQAAIAFGVTEGPRAVARRLSAAFDTPPKRAATIARTELLHSYRQAALDRYATNPAVSGWYWLAACDSRTCPVCWGMHGSIHPIAEPFGSHPNCRCTVVPIVAGPPLPTPGDDLFAALTLGQQRIVLGPGRLAAYQDGTPLSAMITTRQHPVYGVTRSLTPLGALAQRSVA